MKKILLLLHLLYFAFHFSSNAQACLTDSDCDDSDVCTSEFCNTNNTNNPRCIYQNACEDSDACTDDVCDNTLGCQHIPVVCADDGYACTEEICNIITGCERDFICTTAIDNPDLRNVCPMKIVLVLDESGSVNSVVDGQLQSDRIRNESRFFINSLVGTNSEVAVIEYDSRARLGSIGGVSGYQVVSPAYAGAFHLYISLDGNSTFDSYNYDPEDGGAGTNWEEAMIFIDNNFSDADLVIFLTDGQPTTYGPGIPTSPPVALMTAEAVSKEVKLNGTHIFVGLLPIEGGVYPSYIYDAVQRISGPDLFPYEQDFAKADYHIIGGAIPQLGRLICSVDLELYKTVNHPTTCVGNTVEFSLILANKGLTSASGIVVTDSLPAGFTYLSDDGSGAATYAGGVVTWNISSLAVGAYDTLKIYALVNPTGDYRNKAWVTDCDQRDADSSPQNKNSIEDDYDRVSVSVITSCDDGDICTVDACDNGTCTNTPLNCDDNNACTVDVCASGTGCAYRQVVCNDNDLCTDDSCDPLRECVYESISCDDGDACTVDNCNAAIGCVTTPLSCGDNDLCTEDACAVESGCVYTEVVCSDNDLCTEDACDAEFGCYFSPVACEDNDGCTSDACEPLTGACSHEALDCDDDLQCTTDACAEGICVNAPIICQDDDPCTLDNCAGGICRFIPIVCNDGDACTVDGCNDGACSYTQINCADSDLCTTDQCAEGVCTHTAIPNCGNSCSCGSNASNPKVLVCHATRTGSVTLCVSASSVNAHLAHGDQLGACGFPCSTAGLKMDAPGGENHLAFEHEYGIEAYPNPFTEILNIRFTLANDSHVRLEIFDLAGQRIAELMNAEVKADALQVIEYKPGSEVSSMILYRLQTNEGTYYGKAMLQR